MSIREIEFYHGCVFARLTQCSEAISIKKINDVSQGFYILNDKVPLYIKHTTKKLSPWHFSFLKNHQDDFQTLKNKYNLALIAFVCGHDGICCLEFDEFKSVLDYVHEEIEWVSIKRRKREQYTVTGKDGEFKNKVAEGDFSKKVCEYLNIKPPSELDQEFDSEME